MSVVETLQRLLGGGGGMKRTRTAALEDFPEVRRSREVIAELQQTAAEQRWRTERTTEEQEHVRRSVLTGNPITTRFRPSMERRD